METIDLTEECSVTFKLGGKEIVIKDAWALDTVISTFLKKAGLENESIKAENDTALLANPNAALKPFVEYTEVRKSIADYMETTYSVRPTEGEAEALRIMLPGVIARKKSGWLASFKLPAS